MLSSILKSRQAILINIQIMRTFVKFKKFLVIHKELGRKLEKLTQKVGKHDGEIQMIFQAIRQLMTPPESSKRRIVGFEP